MLDIKRAKCRALLKDFTTNAGPGNVAWG